MANLFGIPRNRVADLEARLASGNLTALEKLALCVLRGGTEADGAAPMLIDEAQEQYAHGTYRVPVCVVGDPKRLKVVVEGVPPEVCQRLQRAFMDCDGTKVISIPVGTSLKVYEVTPGADVVVDGGTAADSYKHLPPRGNA